MPSRNVTSFGGDGATQMATNSRSRFKVAATAKGANKEKGPTHKAGARGVSHSRSILILLLYFGSSYKVNQKTERTKFHSSESYYLYTKHRNYLTFLSNLSYHYKINFQLRLVQTFRKCLSFGSKKNCQG